MRGCGILVLGGVLIALLDSSPAAAEALGGSLSELSVPAKQQPPSKVRRSADKGDEKNDDGKNDKDDKTDTEDIFGFTSGTDIGSIGDKGIDSESTGRLGKRDGSYLAAIQKLEFGYTPARSFQFTLGASLAYHDVANVTGLEDRTQLTFEGLSFEAKFRLVERELSGIGVTFIVEPSWARIDDTSGEPAVKFGSEFKLAADAELVKDRIYAALNLLYEPEREHILATDEVEKESTFGLFSALAFQMSKGVFFGGEVRYLEKFEGLTFGRRKGDAVFAGPTFYAKLSERVWIAAAWNVQLAGRSTEHPDQRLDLDHFSRHEARLKAGFDF